MNPEDFFGTTDVQNNTISQDEFFGAPSSSEPVPEGSTAPSRSRATAAVAPLASNPVSDFASDVLIDRSDEGGVVKNILKDTVGSRGVAGVFQLPIRALVSGFTSEPMSHLSQSKADLASATLAVLQHARQLPEGPQKAQLLQIAEDNRRVMGMTNEELQSLAELQLSPEEALGTTINADATLATSGKEFGTSLPARMLEGAAAGSAFQVGSNLNNGEKPLTDVPKSAAVGAAIPFVGTLLSKLKQGLGKGIQTLGEKIQTSVIRPTSRDLADGFNIGTVKKYSLGGSLNQTLVKVNTLMNEYGQELRALTKDSADTIDLNTVADATRKQLTSGAKNFGQNQRIAGVLDELDREIRIVSPEGRADLPTAQDVKRQAGTMGAWSYGLPDKDSSAIETVYTTFYKHLKDAIEATDVGPEVKAVNAKLKELIPVHNAVIRRIPVAERNNALSLTDVIGLIGTTIDPRAAAIAVVNKASKSGRVGNALVKTGEAIKGKASTNALTKFIFGR